MNRTNRHTTRRTAANVSPALLSALPRHRQAGVTLIESLICISTLLVGLSAALPGFEGARERRHVEGAAAQLETDLQLTRSLAVAQNRTVRFEIGRDAHGTCYIVHTGSAGDCTCSPQGAACVPGVAALRSQHQSSDTGVAITANVTSMVFEPLRGTVTPTATLRVEGPRVSIRQIINIMGRVRSCSPDGAVPGLKVC